MQILGVLQKIRNDGWLPLDSKTKFKELQQAIDALHKLNPLVGRVVTRQKIWAGRIDKLKFHNGQRNVYLEFTITDCDQNGESRKSAKTYRREVPFDDLVDIQTC